MGEIFLLLFRFFFKFTSVGKIIEKNAILREMGNSFVSWEISFKIYPFHVINCLFI